MQCQVIRSQYLSLLIIQNDYEFHLNVRSTPINITTLMFRDKAERLGQPPDTNEIVPVVADIGGIVCFVFASSEGPDLLSTVSTDMPGMLSFSPVFAAQKFALALNGLDRGAATHGGVGSLQSALIILQYSTD